MTRKLLQYMQILSLRYEVVVFLAIIVLGVTATPAVAIDGGVSAGAESARGTDQPADLFGTSGIFQTITNVMLFLIGAVSVIMIIIGGLRYVLSGGDSTNVTAAKNTILYAIVGIIVAILAFAAVDFVIGNFVESGGAGIGGGSGSGGNATSF